MPSTVENTEADGTKLILSFTEQFTSSGTLFDTDTPAGGYDVLLLEPGMYEFLMTLQMAMTDEMDYNWCAMEAWFEKDKPGAADDVQTGGIRHTWVNNCLDNEWVTANRTTLVKVDIASTSFRIVHKKQEFVTDGAYVTDDYSLYGHATPDKDACSWTIRYVGALPV